MPIRALIVDDERLARKGLRSLLAEHRDVDVVGECGNGRAAVAAIRELAPDLLFLDVQMPSLDGFAVVREVGPARMPTLIFVTAYDEFALRAFEVNAIDYLLKPFDRERFGRALARAREHLRLRGGAASQARLVGLLEQLHAKTDHAERLVVRSGGRVVFLRVDEIDWIEAAGNYARLHVGAHSHMMNETLKSLAASLDPRRFVRIHRSTIVNVDRIRELQPWFHGDQVAILRDGSKLSVSRKYRKNLEE